MTPQEILAKVSAGELSGEELTNTVNELSVDQQTELKKLSAEDTTKTISEMSAIRKEKNRIEELVTAKQSELEDLEKQPPKKEDEPKTPPDDATPNEMKQFRDEQKQKAISKFKSDFGLSDDELSNITDTFSKLDTGKIDSELIYQDLVGVYAFVNKDKLVQADKEKKAREAAAAAKSAEDAGGATGQTPKTEETPKYSEAVTTLAEEAGISEEAAKKVTEEGRKRVYQ